MTYLERFLTEMLGKDTGGERTGGTDICICPECGEEVKHKRGKPCNKMECPECGSPMTGKGTKGQIKKNKENLLAKI